MIILKIGCKVINTSREENQKNYEDKTKEIGKVSKS